jgi:hypothetical protein
MYNLFGELADGVAQNSATLNRIERNQQEERDRTKNIEANTVQTHAMLSDMTS